MLLTSTTEPLTGIAGWAVGIMEALGGPGAALLIALENLFPPLPSEVILPLAGFTAATPGAQLSLLGAILWCTLGSLAGAWALYGLGAWLGPERTRRLLGKLPLVKAKDIERTEAFFERNGSWTVFSGRMVPVFRSLISIPAGVTRMNPWRFTMLTTAGAAIWNTVLVYAGFALGSQWNLVEGYVGVFSKAVVVITLLAVCWWVGRRLFGNRQNPRAVVDPT